MDEEKRQSKYAYLNQLSTTYLEGILRADIESQEEGDVDMILYILEVIEEREKENPTGRLCDVDEAWKEFQEHYMDLEGPLYPMSDPDEDEDEDEDEYEEHELDRLAEIFQRTYAKPEPQQTPAQQFYRTFLKRILPIAATIAVLMAGMITAQAAGLDIFGALGRWTDETFHFVSPQGKNMGQDPKELDPNSQELHDAFQAVLDECEITEPLAPTWFPEGCVMDGEPKITLTDYETKISCEYKEKNQQQFVIEIQQFDSALQPEIVSFEKDLDQVEQYLAGNRLFYIVSNNDVQTATWSDGLSSVIVVYGDISISVLKQILSSMGV